MDEIAGFALFGQPSSWSISPTTGIDADKGRRTVSDKRQKKSTPTSGTAARLPVLLSGGYFLIGFGLSALFAVGGLLEFGLAQMRVAAVFLSITAVMSAYGVWFSLSEKRAPQRLIWIASWPYVFVYLLMLGQVYISLHNTPRMGILGGGELYWFVGLVGCWIAHWSLRRVLLRSA